LCRQRAIFGPILPVRTYGRIDEAISDVNDGLAYWRSNGKADFCVKKVA
jgi:acyl-CoA reductase-like NAD-dependent aldehyde dehydrogenase